MRLLDPKFRKDVAFDVDKQRMIITPILRLVCSLTSLIDTSEFLEVSLHHSSSSSFSKNNCFSVRIGICNFRFVLNILEFALLLWHRDVWSILLTVHFSVSYMFKNI